MKKLLSLLGSIGLLSTSITTVVSCGDTTPPPVVPNEILALIEEFKNDLEKIIDEYWISINNKFFDVSSNTSTTYSFIKESKIKELVDNNQQGALIGDKLSDIDKRLLTADIEKIVQDSNFKAFLLKNIDSKKYSIILEGVDIYNGFEIDWNTLEINYTNNSLESSQREGEFLSYVKVNLLFNFQYLDSENQLTSYKSSKNFVFTLTSNETLITSIQELENNIKSDYFLENQQYSWLDAKSFGYSQDQYEKIFLPKTKDFKNIYESDSFQDNIVDFIKKNYFKNIPSVPLSFEGSIIFDKFIKKDFTYANSTTTYDWKEKNNGEQIYNSIFSEFKTNDQTLIYGSTIADVNTYLYNYLSSNYIEFQKKYLEKFDNFISELQKDSPSTKLEIDSKVKDNSISFGEVKLMGLSIKISESYIHPINDLSIFSSIAVSNDETKEQREVAPVSLMFGAMYYNMIAGIKEYQNIFDIKPRGNEDFPIASFSGSGTSVSGDSDNIWNGIKVSGNQYAKDLNESLSLINKNLIKHRDILLENSNQNIFSWRINREIIGVQHRVDGTGIINVSYYGSFPENQLEWVFKQNFINVEFPISGIWKQNKGKVFIKRVDSN
ncbi:lipoprotein [Spiroplasma endosymbiont of Cantharis lateralis]|uniref:lipoprotein n=1 Tax=Spiroplasma endosymbiont of Cantharis lateralis TaxID=3066277 RepID=UPI00313DBB43